MHFMRLIWNMDDVRSYIFKLVLYYGIVFIEALLRCYFYAFEIDSLQLHDELV